MSLHSIFVASAIASICSLRISLQANLIWCCLKLVCCLENEWIYQCHSMDPLLLLHLIHGILCFCTSVCMFTKEKIHILAQGQPEVYWATHVLQYSCHRWWLLLGAETGLVSLTSDCANFSITLILCDAREKVNTNSADSVSFCFLNYPVMILLNTTQTDRYCTQAAPYKDSMYFTKDNYNNYSPKYIVYQYPT